MESRLLATICVLLAGVAVTGATTTPETYWRTVLPNTPMPQIIKDRLQPGLNETQWGIDPKAVNNVKGTLKQVINPSALADMHDALKGGIHPNVLGVYIGDIPQQVSINDSTSLLFLLEKDIHPGKSMTLDLKKIQTKASFLPRKVAEAIPFSSTKLPDIFNQFLIRPQSAEAELVKTTIGTCEGPTLEGEDKSCVTSLESMIDFATSKLGKDVMVMATEVEKEETPKQEYCIGLGVQKIVNEAEKSSMACHAMNYMYTVYYCHSLKHTTAYTVPLVGADGTKAKAVAFCHNDTARWNPNHLAFQLLNVKPGTVAICHFFQVESIIWLPK